MSDAFHAAANALDTLKPQFLDIQDAILNLNVYSAREGITFPPGFIDAFRLSTNQPGSLSYFTLSAPQDAIAISESSPPHLREMADPIRSECGRAIHPFVRPRCYHFRLYDPHDPRGKSNAVTREFKRASELRNRFRAKADAAGRAIGSIPYGRLTWIDPWTRLCGRCERNPAALWAKIVFDLAWQQRPGTAIPTYRVRVFARESAPHTTFKIHYDDTAASVRGWSARSPKIFHDGYATILDYYGDALPDFFESTIEDITRASAEAAQILAQDLRRLASDDSADPAAPERTGFGRDITRRAPPADGTAGARIAATAGAAKPAGKRGPPATDQADRDFADRWNQAKLAGIPKKQFSQDAGKSLKQTERILARVRMSKSRAARTIQPVKRN
jgi:hypothetical protein